MLVHEAMRAERFAVDLGGKQQAAGKKLRNSERQKSRRG